MKTFTINIGAVFNHKGYAPSDDEIRQLVLQNNSSCRMWERNDIPYVQCDSKPKDKPEWGIKWVEATK